ncbi:MAG: hypothetical protein KDE19_04640 [Caldilineaceae bacterium]|nr:hypothetical protein [Caldilineaceae bacterium]
MRSEVTRPFPADKSVTSPSPALATSTLSPGNGTTDTVAWNNSLRGRWQESPERFAWVVILVSFAVFVTLLVTIPMGVTYTLRYLPAAQNARFVPAGEGVFLLMPPKSTETIAVTSGRNLEAGDVLVATSDATQGVINLINDEEPVESQVVGSLHIYSDTRLEIVRLSRPFFKTWSDEPYQVRLRLDSGQARVFTNSGNARPLAVQLETPHGTVYLESGSYQISVEEPRTDVTVIDGRAELVHEKEQNIRVYAGQRAWMTTDELVSEVAPALQNLIVNGDFTPPALEDWIVERVAETNVPLGQVSFLEREGRKVAYFIQMSSAGQHNEVSIQQQVDKKVDVYNSLILQLDVNVLHQNLPGAGYLYSEFPLRVEINYTDQYGKDLNWGWGFYYDAPPPPSEVPGGEQVEQARWYTYRSPNLIDLWDSEGTRPSRINSIRIYASGWNYQSQVSQVYLNVE